MYSRQRRQSSQVQESYQGQQQSITLGQKSIFNPISPSITSTNRTDQLDTVCQTIDQM